MVAVSTVKMADGKVSCETPKGTVINININQRSCMDCLLDAIKNVRLVKKDGQCNQPAREPASGVYLGVGVSFMTLGFVSVMLAIVFAAVRPQLELNYVGTHFWVGFPFLVAGALNVLAYKYPNALWMVLSFIFLLGCLAVSIAGLVFAAIDIQSFSWRSMADLCDDLRRKQNRYYYATTPPYYRDNSYDTDWNLQRCKNGFQEYKNLLLGLVIMSLLMMIWGICVSTITLIYRLKMFFRACKCEKVEENDDPLLSPNLTPDIIIA
ncbi:transmembrane protein 176B-like [Rana temporaria]|uniref:transmembrane protein 176B-like n=1 Tax=Rana temporaria TaxID=8407 RepID=UPI001AAD020D|nr:transmembrane protein 176B-like [Rana temporaria]